MPMKQWMVGLMAASVAWFQTGCATTDADRATALGAGAGAGLGMVLGHNFGHSEHDRLLGAAAGALVGGTLARQHAERRELERRLDAVQQQQVFTTVWIPNSNGSRTPVTLRAAEGGQYIGPRGEYYAGLPSPEQLRSVYGL